MDTLSILSRLAFGKTSLLCRTGIDFYPCRESHPVSQVPSSVLDLCAYSRGKKGISRIIKPFGSGFTSIEEVRNEEGWNSGRHSGVL